MKKNRSREENFEILFEALVKYKKYNNNLKIPYRWRVPFNSDWPENLWGLKLGARLKSIRMDHKYLDRQEDLKMLGVKYEAMKKYKSFQYIADALRNYKTLHNSLDIPYGYKVPQNEFWDSKFWGMELGVRLYDIRIRGTFKKHRSELTEIGVFESKM